jgi:hypothetical protein
MLSYAERLEKQEYVMWQPSERLFVKYHVAGSIAMLMCGLTVVIICLAPAYFPDTYRFFADDRLGSIPYLLFIALGESIFSIWYFIFRK